MKKYSAIISGVVLGLFALGTINSVCAADAIIATEISKEDAAKQYPPPNGKTTYPEGIATPSSTGGFFQSPYSGRVYDCRKVKKGALVLDAGVKRVFLRP